MEGGERIGTVLTILLGILKWLGILLGGLLALVLLIVLLICLVPIRYQIKARVSEGVKAKGDITWLLHLIHVTLAAINAQILCKIKALGICLKKLHLGKWGEEEKEETGSGLEDSERSEKAETDKEAEKQAEKKDDKKDGGEEEAEDAGSGEEEKASSRKKDKYEALFKALDEREKKKEEARAKAQNGEEEAASSDDPSRKTSEKLQELIDKVSAFWDDEKNRDAVALIERQLLRLGKHVVPTHFLLEGEIGLKDPGATGRLIGKIYRFYPLYGSHIRVDGVFDRQTVNLYTELKGRLRLGIFVEIALRLLLNKRCRTWLKQLLHKDKPAKSGETPEENTGETPEKKPEEKPGKKTKKKPNKKSGR
ncbi:MAG: hypothetical protein J5493_04440 [Lachnospiraceae bacterium]|nr:hypothetical protein [Lachnospiraceae bacterium]